jgi:hypothetical protein
MINEYGILSGMRINGGNYSTKRKPTPKEIYMPQSTLSDRVTTYIIY